MKMIFATLFAAAALAVQPAAADDMIRSDVQIYRAAPGHQLELLKFLQGQDRAAKAAGLKPSQLYVHQLGASWDFVLITPHATDAQSDATDAAAKRLGIAVGPAMGLAFRQHVAEHSDTIAAGPYTVDEWLTRIGN